VLLGFAQKVPYLGKMSRAKAQSATAFLRAFFAPLRLCVRNISAHIGLLKQFEYFLCKAVLLSSKRLSGFAI
jgi:hypothetical protein